MIQEYSSIPMLSAFALVESNCNPCSGLANKGKFSLWNNLAVWGKKWGGKITAKRNQQCLNIYLSIKQNLVAEINLLENVVEDQYIVL